MSPLETAKEYLRRGWHPVPIPVGTKGPTGAKWQLRLVTTKNISLFFAGKDLNVGVQLGPKSNNLCDIDLDSLDAVRIASYFLPDTDAIFGRKTKPRSHYLYICNDSVGNVIKFASGKKDTIVELRMGREKGVQTMFPGSVHPSGEKVEWNNDGEPAVIPFEQLKIAVRNVAVGTILLRHWPESGSRHETALRVGGFLARAGMDLESIDRLIEATCTEAGDDEVQDRRTAAAAAFEAHSNGDKVYGFPSMADALGLDAAETIAKFLDYSQEDSDRVVIKYTLSDASAATSKAEKILGETKMIYQRGDQLVRTVISEVDASKSMKTKVPRLLAIDAMYMKDVIGRYIEFRKVGTKGKWIKIDVPHDIPSFLVRRSGEWTFPVLAGVANTPTMRPDGSILTAAGYDEATRLFVVDPPAMPDIPNKPTKKDARKALDFLCEPLIEFPFVSPVDKAVALSAMMTPVVRWAFPTPPMHTVRSPAPGTGKSYLLDCCAALAIGQRMPVISMGKTEEELEKRLGAVMVTGQPLICIDNVNGDLRGDFLCQIIDRTNIDVRPLGKTEITKIEARGTSIFANGNNMTIVGDLCRRTLTATLDPKLERPELRVFKQRPYEEIVENRSKYIAAVLTVCRAYVMAGFPDKLEPLASFEGWSDLVRSSLVWLGEADPVDSVEANRGEDPEMTLLKEVIDAWSEVIGCGFGYRFPLSQILEIAAEKSPTFAPSWPRLEAVLQNICGHREANALNLSAWLRTKKGRIAGGKWIDCKVPSNNSKPTEWFIAGANFEGAWGPVNNPEK